MTAPTTAERLYRLLPVAVRRRDAELAVSPQSHGPLRELLEVLSIQFDSLSDDLDQFYDDLFIETCADWTVPYIGELVGYRVIGAQSPGISSLRADVAATISYRRRKGTGPMLEQLAMTVTGWPGAHVVEYFTRIAATQYVNHVRPAAIAVADLRNRAGLTLATAHRGAFDENAHTVDVRQIDATAPRNRGRYNVNNIGVFLWRTEPMRMERSPLRPHGTDRRRYRFEPEGHDRPLFGLPRSRSIVTEFGAPADVPLALDVRWVAERTADYYGPGRSILLEIGAPANQSADIEPVPDSAVRICNLGEVPDGSGNWANEPPAGVVAIDPERGRVYFGTPLDATRTPLGTFCRGQAVPAGARAALRADPGTRPPALGIASPLPEPAGVLRSGGALHDELNAILAGGTLQLDANQRWSLNSAITVGDAGSAEPTTVAVTAGRHSRPVIDIDGVTALNLLPQATLLLDGLVIEGGALVLNEVGDRRPRTIVLRDCTLVPGWSRQADGTATAPERASLIILDPFTRVVLDGCVTGPVITVAESNTVLHNCIVDAGAATAVAIAGRPAAAAPRSAGTAADCVVGPGTDEAGSVQLRNCTVLGGLHVTELSCTNTLLHSALAVGDPRPAAVLAVRRQSGCVRYSWLPLDSRTGQRHRCQPTPDQKNPDALRPIFTSLKYHEPGYGQLSRATPDEIRRGADDESEMGAAHDQFAPQREQDLATRLDEYVRFGLVTGIFYAS